ncbi:right-handed parallel beta-helix repeat-containing protein [Cohnella nanjingensis]|uniref:Right-handed parallel beta-helix repeat-containing protein n=1 Tax=Cohnella nanjingensis TaxID=1387779 RepID=A0A7X0RU64_9BACL|nr:NosD domain-containing protein [Cohnella nanjingensis]MBB6673603.1 right-handed parallel beta-helix repeat-containing protein [Cohnella nanjingensis]
MEPADRGVHCRRSAVQRHADRAREEKRKAKFKRRPGGWGWAGAFRSMLFTGLLLGACASAAWGSGAEEAAPLQPLIDDTPAGGTLVLVSDRAYAGPAVIDKTLAIRSDGEALVINHSDKPALSLQADGIRLQDLFVKDGQIDPKKPAILVQSDHNRLERLRIETQAGGIYLREAHDNAILNSRIEGARGGASEAYSRRGNGIDLMNANRNRIEGNTLVHVHDGVYVESSNETRVQGNHAVDSRYGYHFMFSGKPELRNNTGSGNVTGGMIMGVEGAVVEGNRFDKQNENVNSQGILLFDVRRSMIGHNRVEGNRVGIYMENATENALTDNEIVRNFIGMQMIRSHANTLRNSAFVANVNQAQSVDSQDNVLEGNYWDDFQGLDTDGDGFSEMTYEIDPFFLQLTKDTDAYQVFFQAPGLPFLAQMFRADTTNWLKDRRPLLASSFVPDGHVDEDGRILMLFAGAALLLSTLFIIYRWGYRRS